MGKLRDLARAWAAGDVAALEKELLSAFDKSPEIYDRLLVERNRNWLPQVDTCLQQNAGCFIVVGAAHLVGRRRSTGAPGEERLPRHPAVGTA